MNKAEAIKQLEGIGSENQFGMILINEHEVRKICGEDYPHLEKLLSLVSRRFDGSYWYEKRNMWSALIKDAAALIERNVEDDRISNANEALAKELGLENNSISLPMEIRPMQRFTDLFPNMDEVETLEFDYIDGNNFALPSSASNADVLRAIESHSKYHGFIEGIAQIDTNGIFAVHRGS